MNLIRVPSGPPFPVPPTVPLKRQSPVKQSDSFTRSAQCFRMPGRSPRADLERARTHGSEYDVSTGTPLALRIDDVGTVAVRDQTW